MPVLFLTVSAIIFFLLVLCALGVAQIAERKEERRMHFLHIPGKPFTVLSVAQAFEEESAILWETQAPALQQIAIGGSKGVSVAKMRRFFAGTSRQYPELYDGVRFEQWIRFLEQSELIVFTLEDRVAITPHGLQFLRYRIIPRPIAA
ncbi:MAG TPA: hypothetical protein VN577_15555 [Terriglobales bacterium]|nr:hypothetical protein [Terriglobales bacterium]